MCQIDRFTHVKCTRLGSETVELALRRALIGYRRRPTVALFEGMEQESRAAQQARETELQELSSQLDAAMKALRETEALISAEQEQQQVLLALLEELATRGVQVLESARAAFGEREATILGEIARRELALAHRRHLLYALRDDLGAAVRRAMQEIEDPGAEDRLRDTAAPTPLPAAQAADEALRQKRAGA